MHLGLGNLRELKTWLLNPDLVNKTNYDVAIAQLGRGISAQFEIQCSRKFPRLENNQLILLNHSNGTFTVLPRYPVEGTPTLEIETAPGKWESLPSAIKSINPSAGIVEFNTFPARSRITWTGGYWIDDSEDASAQCPDGASPLPEALRFAWLQQCAHIWAKRQKLGAPMNATTSTAEITQELLPDVSATLKTFRRLHL